MRRSRIVALTLAAAAVIGIGISAGAASQTQAAWTDQVHVTATTTAGNWMPVNACTAYDDNGRQIACRISSITYQLWDPSSDGTRHYWVNFDFAGSTARRVTFTADLSTAVRADGQPTGPQWNWERATIRAAGAQFTPSTGWTCADLPEVSGTALEWARNAYFVVDRDGSATGTLCGR